jgi:hypothetical protein
MATSNAGTNIYAPQKFLYDPVNGVIPNPDYAEWQKTKYAKTAGTGFKKVDKVATNLNSTDQTEVIKRLTEENHILTETVASRDKMIQNYSKRFEEYGAALNELEIKNSQSFSYERVTNLINGYYASIGKKKVEVSGQVLEKFFNDIFLNDKRQMEDEVAE